MAGEYTIYFLRNPENGLIKIGRTTNLKKRIRQIELMENTALILLRTMTGEKELEIALHRKFQEMRVSGEWFKPGEELLNFIRNNLDLPNPKELSRTRKKRPAPKTFYLGDGEVSARRMQQLEQLAARFGVTRSVLIQQIADGKLKVTAAD